MKKVFAFMAIAAMFVVGCNKPTTDPTPDPTPDPEPKPEYSGPEQGTSQWSVIGSLAEEAVKMNWDADLVMAASGDLFVLKNLKITAADEFKIRENKDWGNNRGGAFEKLGEGFVVAHNGDNIKPAYAGFVDVWYNPAKEQMAVCETGKNPTWKEIEPEPQPAAITIDGDFSDWAALKEGTFSKTYGDEDAMNPALTHCKVYADAAKIYVYVEWNMDYIEDTAWVPFHCYINTDGDATTGGYADEFADACSDLLLEGAVYADGEICSYWAGAYPWVGEPNASGWTWAPDTDNLFPEEAPTEGAGVDGKYEFSIDRSMLAEVGFPVADVFSIGFDIQQNWSSVGVIPNAAPTEDNASGVVNSLQVTTQK